MTAQLAQSKIVNYNSKAQSARELCSLTTEQLIARLQELEAENAQLKSELLEERRGYIYIVQFDGDVKDGVFKAGKTGKNIENRFANYRTNFGEKLGKLNIKRVAAVSDSLAAEQYMHDLIRKSGVQSINDTEHTHTGHPSFGVQAPQMSVGLCVCVCNQ